jgi:hypothetical protein
VADVNLADIDDTARLILMDRPDASLITFHNLLLAEGCPVQGAAISADLWAKYRGFDGQPPTHDAETGSTLPSASPSTPEV